MQVLKETAWEVLSAVFPLAVVITVLQFTLMRIPLDIFFQFLMGTFLVALGLFFFLLGVQLGLLPIGEQIGSALPATGKAWLVVFFGFLLGFAVTVAEPDVRVLSLQVDMVSEGAISRQMLVLTVALGVGMFTALSMLRTLLGIPLKYILIGGYLLVLLLSFFTPAHFIPVSFDAGGVTTGPLTVPFILALGVGVASVLGGKSVSAEGFGLVALASIGPVLAVMLLGVFFG